MVQKFSNLLVLEEAGTETVSPVLRAYGLVCIMHLSIERATPPPRAYVGQCGGFLWYLKAWLARGGGGFLRICLAYSWKSMEVGERGGDLTRA